MKRLKVLLITAKFSPTLCGVGDYTRHLAQALSERNLDVTVLTKSQGCPSRMGDVNIVQAVKNWSVWELGPLAKSISVIKPDIVHLQYEPFGFRQSYPVPFFFGMGPFPLVTTVHEVWHRFWIHSRRDKFLYRHSDQIIVNDRGAYERLLKIEPEARPKINLIGVGSNIPLAGTAKIKTPEVFKIGYFGFLNRTKRNDLLLPAFAQVIQKYGKKAELLVISPFQPGENPYHKELQDLCRKWNISDKVKFLGALPGEEVAKALLDCDLAVLPYIDGASPRRGSFQACAGLGLPILTTRPLIEDPVVIQNETAVLLENVSVESFSSQIVKILEDPSLRARLSAGAKAFHENFTWEAIADRHLAVYKSLNL